MKFFVDTADVAAISELNDLGMVDGVTTNPSLILKSGRNILEVTKEICDIVAGPVSAEVVALKADEMIAEGRKLAGIAPNIVVKLPLTWDGLRACKVLTGEGHKVNVTLCFSANQALIAAKAGATFISPFIGRLDDINLDGLELISDIRTIYDNYDYKTEILAASIRTANHVTQCALIGADVVTAPPAVIKALASHVLTDKGLEQFMSDWAKTGQKSCDRVYDRGGAADHRGSMIKQDLRDVIIAEPEVILEDPDVMAALIAANERAMGSNIVDLRGIAMERMEARLDRLEDTHRSVIAAAYENLAGTNQVHRAILQMLDPLSFEEFLKGLGTDVAQTLRVDSVRLVLESAQGGDAALARLGETVCVVEPGFVATYVAGGRNVPQRAVTLRQTYPAPERVYGERAAWVRSEALLRLDFGNGRLPGLLALGAEDPHRFKAAQGTDLLAFFGGVFERTMRRWLA